MKKSYKSILLALLTMVGGMGASAQTIYYDVDASYVTEVEAGVDYVLKNSYVGSEEIYVNGTSTSTAVTASNLVQFEQVGTDADGYPTYRLKQTSTGLYIEDPQLSAGTVTLTSSQSRAFVFTAKNAVSSSSEEIEDYTTYTYVDDDGTFYDGSIVFCNVNYASSTYDWLAGTSAGVLTWTQNTDANAWLVYPVTQCGAYQNLYMTWYNLMSSSAPSDLFSEGTSPGQISSELMAALQSAYDAAMLLLETTEASDEEYYAASLALETAYNNAKAGIIPMAEGYYVLTNASADRATSAVSMYDDDGLLYWKAYSYSDSVAYDVDYLDCLWEVTKADEDGGYYLRNVYTDRYIGSQATLYTTVPTTTEAEQVYYIEPQEGNTSAFLIYTTDQNSSYPALHCQVSGGIIVIWESGSEASGWYFTEVSEEVVEGLQDQIAQQRINTSAKTLVEEAEPALLAGYSLISEATKDGYYETDGLVTDATCFFSNAQEPTEGTFEGLIDNDQTTFFHSAWSTTDKASVVHYLGADLGTEVQYLDIKYSRRNTGDNGTPQKVRIYACNDTTGGANWVEQGLYTFTYTYASSTYSSEADDFTGITSVIMDAPYRYIRLDVEGTIGNATTNGNLYFHLSEIRFYAGEYDAANSLIEAVPAEIVTELRTQIAATKAELAAGAVSQTTYDALEAAYEAFVEAYPDIDTLNDLLEEAQAQLEAAEEGTEMGYFTSGSKAVFENALAAIEADIKDVMTASEITDCTTRLNAAIATFTAALIVPTDGTILRIRSASTTDQDGAPNRNYLYAMNCDESRVKWGGYDSETGNDEYLDYRLNYLWKTIVNEDGSFTFLNLGTGTYLGNPVENNVGVYMALEPDTVTLRSAKSPGLFNIVMADNVFANAQPASYNLVTWATASGTDNSAFEFVTVSDWEGIYHYDIDLTTQIITLPMAVTGTHNYGGLYYVLGINSTDNTLELSEYDDYDVIPAGTPFVYIPDDDCEIEAAEFFCEAENLSDLEYDLTAKSNNGLTGVFIAQTVGAGQGIIFNNVVTTTTATDEIAANTGYITSAVSATDEKGDVSLTIDGVIDAIKAVNLSSADAANVYTISGVLVRKGVNAASATSNLPKGLYIVGGKKVYVK